MLLQHMEDNYQRGESGEGREDAGGEEGMKKRRVGSGEERE